MFILLVISLFDGSEINFKVPQDTVWEYKMPYGVLKIPVAKIREIKMGIHTDHHETMSTMVGLLSDPKYGDRNHAMKILREYRRDAYKYILPLKNSSDPEVAKRVEILLKEYPEPIQIMDTLDMEDHKSTGHITITKIDGVSDSLGPLSIKVSQVRLIRLIRGKKTVKLDANAEWTEIGFSNGNAKITATGTVDLWLGTPGAYNCGPTGHGILKGRYPGGALLCRIDGGEPFVYNRQTITQGKVEIKVHGSPWANGLIGGFYDVTFD